MQKKLIYSTRKIVIYGDRMKRTPIFSSIMILVILVTLTLSTIVHASSELTPSVAEFRMLRGTDASKLGTVTYTGAVSTSVAWDYCSVDVVTSPSRGGIYAEIVEKKCEKSGKDAIITIKIAVKGTYTGEDFDWYPFSSVKIDFYGNGTVVDTQYPSIVPIHIKEVKINRIDFDTPPIDTSKISYIINPGTDVNAPTTITIATSADVNLVAELTDYLSVPTTVEVRYIIVSQSPGSTSTSKSAYITFSTDSLTTKFTLSGVPLTSPLPIQVVLNEITLYTTTLDVPSKASEINVGGASISAAPPIQFWEKQQNYKVISQLYINQLNGGSLTISMVINNTYVAGPQTYSSPGPVNLEVSLPGRQDVISGYYEIVYNGPYGPAPRVVVRFSTSYAVTTGGILRSVFYNIFMFIVSAGFTGLVIGLFLRRPDLQSAGLIMLSSGVFIFLIPTLMGYVVTLATHVKVGNQAGIEDPIGASNLTITNLGEVVDRAIEYIQNKAMYYSSFLFNTALFVLGIVGVLAAVTIGGGILGWLTGGALSQFLGQVLGALGSQLISFATMSIMASIFLKVLAIVFPIFLNVIFAILLFVALIQALFAGFTGSYGQVYGTVISLSVLVLTVLLTPCILATLDKVIAEQKITIPVVNIDIPDIFTQFGLVIVQIILLTMILAMAFQRLMATLSGMAM